MELKIRKSNEIYIIDVNGEMDLYNSYKLKELVMKMLEKKVVNFVINLEQVDYIDSSGIGALIYICSTIKKMNLKLCDIIHKYIPLTKEQNSDFYSLLSQKNKQLAEKYNKESRFQRFQKLTFDFKCRKILMVSDFINPI